MNLSITSDIDRNRWNEFVLSNNPWSFFQSYEWGSVQEHSGQKIWRIGIIAGSQLIGVAQIALITAKRGTFLHLRHGPVFTDTYLKNVDAWAVLISYLQKLAQEQHAWFVRLSPMVIDTPEISAILKKFNFNPAPIHAMDAEICWVLDITPPLNDILGGMRKTTRYLVRQAEKMGVQIKIGQSIDQFMMLYKETALRQGFVTHHAIPAEYEIFHRFGEAIVLEAYHEGQLLASAIIVFFGKQAIYHHGASIPSKIPASYALQWYAMSEAKKRGMELYNFWGIAPPDSPNHPWHGLTLFKQGFGGVEKHFLHAQDLPLSPFYRISYTIERVRKAKKGY